MNIFFINICITIKWNNTNNNFVTSSKKQIFKYYWWKKTCARYKTVKQAESSTQKRHVPGTKLLNRLKVVLKKFVKGKWHLWERGT